MDYLFATDNVEPRIFHHERYIPRFALVTVRLDTLFPLEGGAML